MLSCRDWKALCNQENIHCITTPPMGYSRGRMPRTYFQVAFYYCVRQSQTDTGLGTLKSIATLYIVTYMACLYTSHTHRCEGITNRALASGGGCYSPSRVTTENGVVAICSTFFTSHSPPYLSIFLTGENARISSICSLPQRNWQDLAHLSVRGHPHEKEAKCLYHLLPPPLPDKIRTAAVFAFHCFHLVVCAILSVSSVSAQCDGMMKQNQFWPSL